MLSIGKEFRTSMQNIIRMTHSAGLVFYYTPNYIQYCISRVWYHYELLQWKTIIVIRMENPEQKESIRHLIFSIDFTGFYTEDVRF